MLLLSPPGCGESQFCKALGKEVGRPVLILDVGTLMGSLVGQSEERTRQALRIIDAMAPCVAMIDEVEKAFAGMSGAGDSGVASRMFGTFLSWLNDVVGVVMIAAILGAVTSSWIVFLAALALLLACSLHAGSIRPPRGR